MSIAFLACARSGASILSDRQAPFANPGHGVWEHQGGNEFAYTFMGDDFNAVGNFLGTLKVRQKLTLTGPDELVGVGNAELRDASGNLLFTRCNTIRGQRIKVELLPELCWQTGSGSMANPLKLVPPSASMAASRSGNPLGWIAP
jgi:hypothetical protein